MQEIWSLTRRAVAAWSADYAASMGAALAYYTLFSIAPLLLIVISIAGLFFGPEAARGEIFGELQGLLGPEGAAAVEKLLQNVNKPAQSGLAAVVGVAAVAGPAAAAGFRGRAGRRTCRLC